MENTLNIPEQSGSYKITCLLNNKIYIGQSKNLKKRFLTYQGVDHQKDSSFRSRRPIIYAIKKI